MSTHSEAIYAPATRLIQAGDLVGAVTKLTGILSRRPNDHQARYLLGMCHLHLKNFEAAARQFKIILKAAPNNFNAAYQLGVVYESLGRRQDASDAWQRALSIRPDFAPARAKLHRLTGKPMSSKQRDLPVKKGPVAPATSKKPLNFGGKLTTPVTNQQVPSNLRDLIVGKVPLATAPNKWSEGFLNRGGMPISQPMPTTCVPTTAVPATTHKRPSYWYPRGEGEPPVSFKIFFWSLFSIVVGGFVLVPILIIISLIIGPS